MAYKIRPFTCGIKIAHPIVVSDILLCTHNPILIKNFYGILRDEGFTVEIADHSALAVQMVIQKKYVAVIIDSESFGLSAEEAVQIIRGISPDILVIFIGYDRFETDALSIKIPVDLEEFKQAIHDIQRFGGVNQTL